VSSRCAIWSTRDSTSVRKPYAPVSGI
jgi:hypothetical protein